MPLTIPEEFIERVAEKFWMLSDPTRLRILRTLMGGEKNVGQVVAETGQNQANVSKHLKMLADAGMVGRRKAGLQVFYTINDPLIERLCELVCGSILQQVEAELESHRKTIRTWRKRN